MRIKKEPTTKYQYVFEFEFDYGLLTFCRALKSQYGVKEFGFEFNRWRFNSLKFIDIIKDRFPEVAIDANMQFDIEMYDVIKKEEKLRVAHAQELKTALTTDFKVNNVKLELRPYQRIGIEYFVNSKGRAILADEPGVGKTAQALGFIAHQQIDRTLVVCPASVKYVWEEEAKKFTDLKTYVINSTDKRESILNNIADSDVVIINYDVLKKFVVQLLSWKPKCITLDEFHYIKNINAKRTKLVRVLCAKVSNVLLLSGTPFLNRPVELFTGLQILDPSTWNNWFEYTRKYCNGHKTYFGWDASGSSNIEELRERISPYFLRRLKKDIIKELPPKQFVDIPVELSPEILEQYRLAESSFIEFLRKIKKRNNGEIMRSLSAEKLTKLSFLRQLTTAGKEQAAKEIIDNIIAGEEKIVVFSVYNEQLENLKKHFGDRAVMITGKTKVEERGEIVKSFQNNEKIKVFLGGTLSAGTGITLTAASNVLFIDYDFVPANHKQCADRVHRISQTADSVTIYQLFSRGTIDEKMKDILYQKQRLFDKLIDGVTTERGAPSNNLINDLLASYDKQ